MSLRYEQFNALKRTRDFLRLIIEGKQPTQKTLMRKMAGECLRHYPFLNANGKPMWSNDPFTTDEGKPTP